MYQFCLALLLLAAPLVAAPGGNGPNITLEPSALVEYEAQPERVRALLQGGLELASRHLTYQYGSADPANGGMDCSGFIYHLLRAHGFADVPRDSSGQYVWARKARGFRSVISLKADSFEFRDLLPGDLLFWSGTYSVRRDPPVTHTMIYLGTEKSTGQRVMVGSSDGRTYRGVKRWGVSVFDFVMPKEGKARFLGYARIPGLRSGG